MKANLFPSNWIITGDFNMVEFPDDSFSPSPLIHGIELRAWCQLIEHLDLVDNYLCATSKLGPHCTRQAKSLIRFDQARLDRSYSSNQVSWTEYIKAVEHDGRQVLSNHILVTIIIMLKEGEPPSKKCNTYFKMDVSLLWGPGVMDKVQAAWEECLPNTNPRVRWGLCLQKVKKILKAKKWRRALDKRDRGILADRLLILKREVGANPTPKSTVALNLLEAEVKQQELDYAITWCRRSRVRWLTLGEAPSRYFFAQMKAKHARDTIRALLLESGKIV